VKFSPVKEIASKKCKCRFSKFLSAGVQQRCRKCVFFRLRGNTALNYELRSNDFAYLRWHMINRVTFSSMIRTPELMLKPLFMPMWCILDACTVINTLLKVVTIKPWVNTIFCCDHWAWSRTQTGGFDSLHCRFRRALKSLLKLPSALEELF